jgi:hypothetical protein
MAAGLLSVKPVLHNGQNFGYHLEHHSVIASNCRISVHGKKEQAINDRNNHIRITKRPADY